MWEAPRHTQTFPWAENLHFAFPAIRLAARKAQQALCVLGALHFPCAQRWRSVCAVSGCLLVHVVQTAGCNGRDAMSLESPLTGWM